MNPALRRKAFTYYSLSLSLSSFYEISYFSALGKYLMILYSNLQYFFSGEIFPLTFFHFIDPIIYCAVHMQEYHILFHFSVKWIVLFFSLVTSVWNYIHFGNFPFGSKLYFIFFVSLMMIIMISIQFIASNTLQSNKMHILN